MRALLTFLLLILLFVRPGVIRAQVLSSAAPAEAQRNDFAGTAEWHYRFELFQMLLEQSGLRAQTQLEKALDDPRRSVIVVLGNPAGVLHPRLLEQFCNNGGAVLMATDDAAAPGSVATFFSGPVHALTEADQYQRHSDCVEVRDLSTQHPLMQGVRSLVLNRAGWIDRPRWTVPGWEIAAVMPRLCSPAAANGQPVIASYRPQPNAGPLILVSDQSLFSNGMLWHGDNAVLAINVSRMLAQSPRNQLVFIVNRTSVGSYLDSPALKQPVPPMPEKLPEPKLKTMLDVANSVVRNVQKSNLLNEALINRPREVNPSRYRRALLFVAAAAALLFAVWRLADAVPAFSSLMPFRKMKSAHQLSVQAQAPAAEFGQSARLLARDFFQEVSGSAEIRDWKKFAAEQRSLAESPDSPAPRRTLTGLFRRSRDAADAPGPHDPALQNQLTMILDLAVGRRRIHISRRRFEFLGRTIRTLRHTLERGRDIS
ncbi:MAG: hypothetical protein KDA89_02765 [Planctomycetaceae bacterium]|nr:hypothetical protein [Planctomycetaceae bacterium]